MWLADPLHGPWGLGAIECPRNDYQSNSDYWYAVPDTPRGQQEPNELHN